MVTPAAHGPQRRPLALALATIMKEIGKGGACATDIGKLPIMALTELGENWSQKKTAAAENSPPVSNTHLTLPTNPSE